MWHEEYKWKKPVEKTIIEHIQKHIFDSEYEKKFWRKEFGSEYSELISCGRESVSSCTEIFHKYRSSADKNIHKAKNGYIYRTDSHEYSVNLCNHSNNNLTTCLKLSYNPRIDFEDRFYICSCFFKKQEVLDSTIIYSIKHILDNDINVLNSYNQSNLFSIDGLKVYEPAYEKCIKNAIYSSTNGDKAIDLIRKILFYYLNNQYNYKGSKIKYLKPLLLKINYNNVNDCKIEPKEQEVILNELQKGMDDLKRFKEYPMDIDENDIECEEILLELSIASLNEFYLPKNPFAAKLIQEGLFIKK